MRNKAKHSTARRHSGDTRRHATYRPRTQRPEPAAVNRGAASGRFATSRHRALTGRPPPVWAATTVTGTASADPVAPGQRSPMVPRRGFRRDQLSLMCDVTVSACLAGHGAPSPMGQAKPERQKDPRRLALEDPRRPTGSTCNIMVASSRSATILPQPHARTPDFEVC